MAHPQSAHTHGTNRHVSNGNQTDLAIVALMLVSLLLLMIAGISYIYYSKVNNNAIDMDTAAISSNHTTSNNVDTGITFKSPNPETTTAN